MKKILTSIQKHNFLIQMVFLVVFIITRGVRLILCLYLLYLIVLGFSGIILRKIPAKGTKYGYYQDGTAVLLGAAVVCISSMLLLLLVLDFLKYISVI